mgnify:CR=1 FL=1
MFLDLFFLAIHPLLTRSIIDLFNPQITFSLLEVGEFLLDLVKTMLSKEVQIFEQDGNPINIEAYKDNAQNTVDIINSQYDSYIRAGFDEAELVSEGVIRADEKIVDYMVDIANNIFI